MTFAYDGSRILDGGAAMGLTAFFQLVSLGATTGQVTQGGLPYNQIRTQLAVQNALDPSAVITWSTPNTDIASVSSTGLVTSLATGTATIQASCTGFDAAIQVQCALQQITSLTVASSTRVFARAAQTFNYTVAGVIYQRVDPDIYNDQYQLTTSIGGTLAWSVSDGSAATITQTGLVTGLRSAVVLVTVTNGTATSTLSLGFSETAPGTPTITGYNSDYHLSSKATMDAFFAARLGGNPTPATVMPIYTSENHAGAVYVRNTSCWMRDFPAMTCISAWNSTGQNTRAGTLITPRHILFAQHYLIANGATVRYVAMDNTVVNRTLVSQVNVSGDCTLGVLDSDVPAGISFAKVLPDDYSAYFPVTSGFNTLRLNQFARAVTGQIGGALNSFVGSATYPAYSTDIIGGDSGQPGFLVLGNDLVILTTWNYGGGGMGPNLTGLKAAINTSITALDVAVGSATGYKLTDTTLINSY